MVFSMSRHDPARLGSQDGAHNWTTRQTTSASGSYERQTYLDDIGHNTVTSEGSVQHTWNLTRVVGLTGSYRYSDAQLGGARDMMIRQRNSLAATCARRRIDATVAGCQPTRSMRFSGSIGATRAETLDTLTRVPLDTGRRRGSSRSRRIWAERGCSMATTLAPSMCCQGVTLESFATNRGQRRGERNTQPPDRGGPRRQLVERTNWWRREQPRDFCCV